MTPERPPYVSTYSPTALLESHVSTFGITAPLSPHTTNSNNIHCSCSFVRDFSFELHSLILFKRNRIVNITDMNENIFTTIIGLDKTNKSTCLSE